MTELSDELLVAYVDGQLAREQTRAIDKVLEQDEVVARRLDALKEAHGRLEAAFEAILAGEMVEVLVSPTLPPPIKRKRRISLPWIGLAVVGMACGTCRRLRLGKRCGSAEGLRPLGAGASAQAWPPASSRRRDSAADRRGSRRCAPCCSNCYRA
jgi:hypothetical protein